ncbi:alpha/beta hydrolase [Lysobacter korlensis]|uniref:Alpha/beta hydrolase n=1 Tax=Lysobacter korlensis TaxID=553636 RepID=A0ABV6RV63_9GAMM
MFLPIRRERHRWMRARLVAVPMLFALAAVGCAGSGGVQRPPVTGAAAEAVAEPVLVELPSYPGVTVLEDEQYATAGGEPLLLDVCLPPEAPDGSPGLRAAVVSIHGGSWSRGDKTDPHWRNVCEWLASDGFVVFSINYRLAPEWTFPAQPDDVRSAVAWIREPEQLRAFSVDPARIGAFGGSAGGNLAALLGTEGTGPLTEGTRVAAVAELSGPADLTGSAASGPVAADFARVQASYLGCLEAPSCDAAEPASPLSWIDPTDPPFFIGHAANERIPLAQSRTFAAALEAAGVPVQLAVVDGMLHSVALLNEPMRVAIRDFFLRELG